MRVNKVFRRNLMNKVIGGVCSGLADYFDIDRFGQGDFRGIVLIRWCRSRIVSPFMDICPCQLIIYR